MGKKNNPAQDVINTARTAYQPTGTPSNLENTVGNLAGDVGGVYRNAVAQSNQDYGDTMAGYKNFQQTGGFSDSDLANMRARATSPIRAQYAQTMQNLDRARALGGGGANAPNYIAAVSKAQRQLPQQLSDATIGVNSNIAQMVQQGKEFGQTGGASLYGTTPGLASSYANQLNNLWGTQAGLQQMRQNYGLGLLGAQLGGYSANQGQQGSIGNTLMGLGGSFLSGFFSDRTMKKNIKEVDMPITDGLRKIKMFNWEYKGDNTKHIGPMAQDFKRIFGVGDGKTIHPVDVLGVVLGSQKELAHVTRP